MQGRMKWRNCRMALLCYVTGKVGRILIQNENCVYGYQAACTQPKQPNEFGSFGGQSTVPPLHSSLQQCIDTPLGLGSYLQINFFKSVIKLPEKLKINLFFLKETIRWMARQAIFFIKENRYSPKTNFVFDEWKLYLEQLNTEISHEQKKREMT